MNIDKFIKENLLLGHLCEGLSLVTGGQNQMWRGFVSTTHGDVEAYIKKCRKQEAILVEIIVALIGRIYKLPIPRPIIVKVDVDHPEVSVSETTYLYGSEASASPNFSRFLREYNEPEDIILNYKDLHKILTFDELIANPDRNKDNILFDGDRYEFIDHEYCFWGKQNPKSEIADELKIGNISDIYKHYHGGNEVLVHKTMTKVKKHIKDDIEATSGVVFDTLGSVKIDGTEYANKIDFVKKFILERLPVLDVLIKNSIEQDSDTNQLDFAGGWNV
ncbi:hypothetical protein PS357_13345 [Acinetobacter nosocomialis]|uniref:HipA family kinase n=1 Tax=Acinetobacter calcoaceticus/baumannii complex TaxID=909768 RepID=UPI00068214D5|nr:MULTISPECIES: HipA family kinase [Acinetobacter calcoaceticus/baumannii complex]MDB0300238.1 hypothetical protein [Acinetobacter baumannii]MDC9816713.1 hypothetical protein [Acinetobacter nosocomialis]MDE9406027.1 hypothetical protein [Acinetobacter nosocomialis]MDO7201916.1 hypothetical protein [Acinetobacter baumannii]QPF41849.1 hypothetical protein H0S59_04365 [Acinetobacter nosocomialis]